MIKDMRKVKDKVATLLAYVPTTRDSDKLLWLKYLESYTDIKLRLGPVAFDQLAMLIMEKDTPTMESIRRVRQKYQEEGLYRGTKRLQKLAKAEETRTEIRDLV